MMKKTAVFLFLLALLMSGCEGYSEEEIQTIATQAARGTPPPPVLQTSGAEYGYYFSTLTPTASGLSAVEIAATYAYNNQMMQSNMAATQSAFNAQMERERIAAVQRELDAKATAASIQSTQDYIHGVQTQSAQATVAQATEIARAESTRQQFAINRQSTEQAWRVTEAVFPTHNAWTQEAVKIQMTITAGEAERVRLEVEKQQAKNLLDAYLPWAIVVFTLGVSSEGMRKWLKTKVFQRDESGKSPVVAMETDNGNRVIVRPELMTTPTMVVTPQGQIVQYQPGDPVEQSNVTKRSQLIEAISQLPPQMAQQGRQMLGVDFGRSKTPTIEIGSGDKAWVEEAEEKLEDA